MNDFTTEDLISFIELSHTLSEEEKFDLKRRILDELESRDNILSKQLSKEISDVFERDLKFVEEELLPEQDMNLAELEREYAEELFRIQPELHELVDDYETATRELYDDYNKEYLILDKEFDQVAQEEIGHYEATEIAALQAKLKKK